jgi:hypothetical protein
MNGQQNNGYEMVCKPGGQGVPSVRFPDQPWFCMANFDDFLVTLFHVYFS